MGAGGAKATSQQDIEKPPHPWMGRLIIQLGVVVRSATQLFGASAGASSAGFFILALDDL
jgi:hypothetical protein